jgi:hypothetical protein
MTATSRRQGPLLVLCIALFLTLCLAACGTSRPSALASSSSTTTSLPVGVLTATQACTAVVDGYPSGFYIGVKQVHLVLTTYAKGEPVESQGDISPEHPDTLVWIVEVHAKAIHWDHSVPRGYRPPKQPPDDYSVVMDAYSGNVSDSGECTCWPLPLHTLGPVVSLPPTC